jgi:hypothetical protein
VDHFNFQNPLQDHMMVGELRRALPELRVLLDRLIQAVQGGQRLTVDTNGPLRLTWVDDSPILSVDADVVATIANQPGCCTLTTPLCLTFTSTNSGGLAGTIPGLSGQQLVAAWDGAVNEWVSAWELVAQQNAALVSLADDGYSLYVRAHVSCAATAGRVTYTVRLEFAYTLDEGAQTTADCDLELTFTYGSQPACDPLEFTVADTYEATEECDLDEEASIAAPNLQGESLSIAVTSNLEACGDEPDADCVVTWEGRTCPIKDAYGYVKSIVNEIVVYDITQCREVNRYCLTDPVDCCLPDTTPCCDTTPLCAVMANPGGCLHGLTFILQLVSSGVWQSAWVAAPACEFHPQPAYPVYLMLRMYCPPQFFIGHTTYSLEIIVGIDNGSGPVPAGNQHVVLGDGGATVNCAAFDDTFSLLAPGAALGTLIGEVGSSLSVHVTSNIAACGTETQDCCDPLPKVLCATITGSDDCDCIGTTKIPLVLNETTHRWEGTAPLGSCGYPLALSFYCYPGDIDDLCVHIWTGGKTPCRKLVMDVVWPDYDGTLLGCNPVEYLPSCQHPVVACTCNPLSVPFEIPLYDDCCPGSVSLTHSMFITVSDDPTCVSTCAGTVETDCCPDDLLPETLRLTITPLNGTACMAGTYTLIWNSGDEAWEFTGLVCSADFLVSLVCGADGNWYLSGTCGGGHHFFDLAVLHKCCPFHLTNGAPVLLDGACWDGTGSIGSFSYSIG